MKHASLRQLQVFESVARNLSFTRASEELHLTQPTVSIQLKQLTDIVGLPLLEQHGKRISLTDTGSELLALCRNIFEELSRFEMLVSDMKGVKAGHLRLAVVTTAKYFIPRLLGEFCERYPGIDVSLKVSNRERILQRMENNEDDLYIVGQPPEHLDIHAEPFLENPLVVFASSKHPLAKEKNISLARLAKEPFLAREAGSGTRLASERYLEKQQAKFNIRMELGSNEAIKQAVAGGLGVAILSAHTLALERKCKELCILDVKGFPIRRKWYAVYLADKRLSVVARTFLAFLMEDGRQIANRYLSDIIESSAASGTASRRSRKPQGAK